MSASGFLWFKIITFVLFLFRMRLVRTETWLEETYVLHMQRFIILNNIFSNEYIL